jgi:hypothetical protein
MYSLRDMFREASPTGAIADMRAVYQQAGKNRWLFMLISAAMTVGMFSLLTGQSWTKARALPEITYITSWSKHRTEAETRAFVAENQRRKEALQALQDKADQEVRDLYKSLGRASGMDVDSIDKRGEAERAAEVAAEKARIDAIIKTNVKD